jgi:integrase
MSSIHKTESGTYRVKYREHRRQKSKTFRTEAEARTFAERVRHDLSAGKPIRRRQDVPELMPFALQWLADRSDLSPQTERLYLGWLKAHVFEDLGHLPLIDIRPRRLKQWQDDRLAAGAGPAAIGKVQAVLSQIMDYAVLPYEYIEVNPVAALKRPAYRKREHRWLVAEEVEKLRSWFIHDGDQGSAVLVSILAYVGIRPQDALALEWSHVGEKLTVIQKVTGGKIVSGSKTGEGHKRAVYVPEPVRADLEAWRLESSGAGLIFPRSVDGKPWTKDDWDNWRARRFKAKAAKQTGLGETLRPYDLRHTAATLYAAAGWTHVEIAHQQGNSPEESMRTYQHLIESAHGQPRRSVEDWIRQARGEVVKSPIGV